MDSTENLECKQDYLEVLRIWIRCVCGEFVESQDREDNVTVWFMGDLWFDDDYNGSCDDFWSYSDMTIPVITGPPAGQAVDKERVDFIADEIVAGDRDEDGV